MPPKNSYWRLFAGKGGATPGTGTSQAPEPPKEGQQEQPTSSVTTVSRERSRSRDGDRQKEEERIALAERKRSALHELLRLEDEGLCYARTQWLQAPYQVPPFFEAAKGTPLEWNAVQPLIWNKRVAQWNSFSPIGSASIQESLGRVETFLRLRYGPDGINLRDYIGDIVPDETGDNQIQWFKMDIRKFISEGGIEGLPKTSPGPFGNGKSDWQLAYHGCKFEALYSILYHGKLFASCDADRGDRFFGKAPGVYLHKNQTAFKTANYFRFVPLCQDGVFWAAMFGVMVDRADRVPVQKTDQWVQPERSVRLACLYLAGARYQDMQPGWEVSQAWDPLMEANPMTKNQEDIWATPEEDGARPVTASAAKTDYN